MAKKKAQKGVGQKVVDQSARDEADAQWKEIGLDSTARQALVEAKLLKVSDLRKVSLDKLKLLHGIGPNEIRILASEMKKRDISFRTGK
jgi:hypothetical protein